MPRSVKTSSTENATPEERWTVVQVAAFLGVSYQTARNNMLAQDYGPSEYDPVKRKLTVIADRVRSVKSKRGRKPTRKR